MAKAWYDYSALSAALSLANDDLLARDKSDTTDNATHGTVLRLPIDGLLGLSGITPGGRLTLESGVPVSTSNQTAKGTLYYTPFVHDYVRLYDGTRPKLYQFSELSLSLTVTSGSNYDVFVYDNSGTLTLELSSAWTNDTTRANALAWQSGVGYVKSGTATRLWLGTIRASGTNTCEFSPDQQSGSACKLFLWNNHNRVMVPAYCHDPTDSWTYTTDTWRQARASSGNQIEFVCGQAGSLIAATTTQIGNNSGAVSIRGAIGYDSTSSPASRCDIGPQYIASGSNLTLPLIATLQMPATLGYHYLSRLERSVASGTTTWYGDNGAATDIKTSLRALIEC